MELPITGYLWRWDNLDVGLYTGNGTSQTVSNVGFQAEFRLRLWRVRKSNCVPHQSELEYLRPFEQRSNAGGITSFGSDNFAVGNSTATNQNAINYHYFAFNDNTNYFRTGTYTGNGADNRNITGVGFESEFVIVKATSTNNFAIGKTESTGYNVDANVAGSTNQLQLCSPTVFKLVSILPSTRMVLRTCISHEAERCAAVCDYNRGYYQRYNHFELQPARNQGGDSAISLREAITAANATRNVNGDVDEINFAISGTGVRTITLASTLPYLSDAVKIDAWTQSGWNNSPLIELNGNGVFQLWFCLRHHQRWKYRPWIHYQSSLAWNLYHQLR